MSIKNVFGARLRELRLSAGLTLRDLAEKVNVSFTYLSKIENGALPPPSEKVIRQLAETLNADKDELLSLAGIIPSDIAEILKDRKAIEQLRSRYAKQKAAASGERKLAMPRLSPSFKGLYRLALPVLLVIAVAASLWYASPTKALEIEFPDFPANGTLGSPVTLKVKVSVEDQEVLPLQKVDVTIYKADDRANFAATLESLPTADQAATAHVITEGAASGTATVASVADATWGYSAAAAGNVTWGSTAYTFAAVPGGYAYQAGTGTTSITYTIVWTPPSNWPAGNYKVEAELNTTVQNPGGGTAFTKSSTNSFTLAAGGGGGGGIAPPPTAPGTTDVSDSVDESGTFTESVTATSVDGNVQVNIAKDTVGYTKDAAGNKVPLDRITIAPASKPSGASTVMVRGQMYDLGPSGAVFETPVTLTFNINRSDFAAGEEPVINYWDADAGAWVPLEGCEVVWNNGTGTVSVAVDHFTVFAVLAEVVAGPAPAPAPPAPAPPAPAPPAPAPAPPAPAPPAPAPPAPAPTPTPTPAPAPAPTGMPGWVIPVIIVIAVIIVALIIWFLVARRRG